MATWLTIEKNGNFEYNQQKFKIVFVNSKVTDKGLPTDIRAYPPIKGTCLSPDVLPGDMVFASPDWPPRDNDFVLVTHDKEYILQRYRNNGEDTLLESNHGRYLWPNGCSLIGTVVLIARSDFGIVAKQAGWGRIF